MARETHPATTRALIADGLDLVHRLPLTWAVVEAGECEPWVARKVAVITRALLSEQVVQGRPSRRPRDRRPRPVHGAGDRPRQDHRGRPRDPPRRTRTRPPPALRHPLPRRRARLPPPHRQGDRRRRRLDRRHGRPRRRHPPATTHGRRPQPRRAPLPGPRLARPTRRAPQAPPRPHRDQHRVPDEPTAVRRVAARAHRRDPHPVLRPPHPPPGRDSATAAACSSTSPTRPCAPAPASPGSRASAPSTSPSWPKSSATPAVTVTPVLDLRLRRRVDAYEHPEVIKDHVWTQTGGDMLPVLPAYGDPRRRRLRPHHPLRRHRRHPARPAPTTPAPSADDTTATKTHGGYTTRVAGPGRYLWRTPHGLSLPRRPHRHHPTHRPPSSSHDRRPRRNRDLLEQGRSGVFADRLTGRNVQAVAGLTTAHILGNSSQNSPPPHESTRPPACSIACREYLDRPTDV